MRRTPPVLAVLVALLAAVPPAAGAVPGPPPRTERLISAGAPLAFSGVFADAVSANGTAVFETTDSLLGADLNTFNDVYARRGGVLRLVSSGSAATGDSFYLGMSADGDRVWYSTKKRDVNADTDTSQVDIYERRLSTNVLRQISAGNGPQDVVSWVDGSDDGSHVLFFTGENVPGTGDTDGKTDLFDRRADGSVHLVTPHTALDVNIAFQSTSNQHAISADGTHATFFSQETLAPTGGGGGFGDTYSVSLATGAYTLLTPGVTGETASGIANRAGTELWFTTKSKLVPADRDTAADVYEWRPDGKLRLVSFGPTPPTYLGQNADGSVVFTTPDNNAAAGDNDGVTDLYLRRRDGGLVLLTPGTAAAVALTLPNVTPSLPHIPSDQGRVVFDTTQKLVPADTDILSDAYEATANGLRLLATSPGSTTSTPAQTVDGSRVLFNTFDGLVGADTGGNEDVYEADYAVPVLSGIPTLSGTSKFAGTLTCKAPAFVGEGVTMLFSWLRDGTVAATTTSPAYHPVVADAGHTLRCRAIARNGVGADSADSPTSIRIAPGPRQTALGGFPIVGTKLTCTGFAGATRTTYTWKRGSTSVRGRTTSSYKVSRSDLGKRVTCSATGRSGALVTTVALQVLVPRQCVVPNVRGLLPADAKTKLGSAGCRSTVKRVSGSGVAKGRVLGTTPARRAKRANGATITIRVRR